MAVCLEYTPCVHCVYIECSPNVFTECAPTLPPTLHGAPLFCPRRVCVRQMPIRPSCSQRTIHGPAGPSNAAHSTAPFAEAKVACNTLHSISLIFIPIHIQKKLYWLESVRIFNDRSLFFSNRPYCFVPSFAGSCMLSQSPHAAYSLSQSLTAPHIFSSPAHLFERCVPLLAFLSTYQTLVRR